jgi:hypothetical protein
MTADISSTACDEYVQATAPVNERKSALTINVTVMPSAFGKLNRLLAKSPDVRRRSMLAATKSSAPGFSMPGIAHV